MVLLALGLWVHFFGLPGVALDSLKRVAERQGLYLDAYALYFKWNRGLVATGVVLFNPEDRVTPAIRVESLKIKTSLWGGIRNGEWLKALELKGTDIRDPIGASDSQAATIRDLALRMKFSPRGYEFEGIQFNFHGLQLEGSGAFLSLDSGKSKKVAAVPSLQEIHHELKSLDPLLVILAGISFSRQPVIHVDFLVDENNPLRNHLEAVCSYADGARFQGQAFDSMQFRAEMRDEVIRIDQVSVTLPDGFLRGSLLLDGKGRIRTADARIDLAPAALAVLLPSDLLADMQQHEFTNQGRVKGHVDFRRLPGAGGDKELLAEISLEDARWREIRVRNARGRLSYTPSNFSADLTSVLVGGNPDAGLSSTHITFDRKSRKYDGQVMARVNPQDVLSAIRDDPFLHELISRFSFQNNPGPASFVFSGIAGDGKSLFLDGTLSGTNLVYQSVAFDDFSGHLTISNRNVRVSQVDAVQSGQPLQGWFEINRNKRMIDFDASSRVHPVTITHIVYPEMENRVARLELGPPFDYWARGTIDMGSNHHHRVVGQLKTGRIGYGPHILEQADIFATLTDTLLTLPNFAGFMAGGKLQGMAQMAGVDPVDNAIIYADVGLDSVGMNELMTRLKIDVSGKDMGVCSGRISMEGRISEDWKASLAGAGDLAIRNGKLFQIAFFGGLSKLLSAIIPGFGYAEQTDLTTGFRVEQQRVILMDTKLLGGVISAIGSGHIGFDKSLSVVVQVKLMREGFVAKTLQIISWPITKLLEFKLIGTIDKPDWRPQNLPKELFLKF